MLLHSPSSPHVVFLDHYACRDPEMGVFQLKDRMWGGLYKDEVTSPQSFAAHVKPFHPLLLKVLQERNPPLPHATNLY